MELHVHGLLPSMPLRLCFLIFTACFASLLPCSLCSDASYEYCQNAGRRCGGMNITYPFGVGNRGCGLPGFQIDCVENSSPVIAIHGWHTIKKFYYDTNQFVIFRNQSCQFLDDPINIEYNYADPVYKLISKTNWTLNVYVCNKSLPEIPLEGEISKCNASVYYSSSFDKPADGNTIPGCTMRSVPVEVAKIEWNSNYSIKNDNCRSCVASGGICGYNISDSAAAAPFVCYCKGGPRNDSCSHGKELMNGAAIGAGVGLVVLIAAGLLVGLIWYRRRKTDCFREGFVVRGVTEDKDRDIEAVVQDRIGALPIFSYEVLKQATNDFDHKNRLGDGGFSSVYLGKLPDGRAVAVKRLYEDNSRRVQQFINEVQILSISYHPNLVRLYGCTSPESRDLLLVYEYVPNGTLEDHLHGERKKDKGLNWDTRLKICIETAQALAFLHCLEPPIIHRDVKSPNILLDDDLHVKVADFGLSRFVPFDVTHVSTAPQGTPGYVDPEYYQCFQLTDKSDVYSFGVVLMEIISAKLAMDINRTRRDILLANMAVAKIQAGALHELIDPNLEIDSNPDIEVTATAVAKLGYRCLAPEKEDRPDMKEVVAELEQIKQNGKACKHSALHFHSPNSVHQKWPSSTFTTESSASLIQSTV